MKKILRVLVAFLCSVFGLTLHSQVLAFSVSSPTQCFNYANTATAVITGAPATANSFSWTVSTQSCSASLTPATNGTSVAIFFNCCNIYTLTCTAWNTTLTPGTPIAVGSAQSSTINIACLGPLFAVASSTSICAGSTSTLVAGGVNTYTWMPGTVNGSSMVVSPLSSTFYTVVGTTSLGCTAMSTVFVNVFAAPTVSAVASQTSICAGGSVSLTGTGNAFLYTYSGNSAVVAPSVTTCYTVVGTSLQNCTASAVACVQVLPVPSLAVSGNTIICQNSTTTLSAAGAMTYTWTGGSGPITGANLIVSPSVSSCYTLTGSNGSCTANAITCVLVNPAPNISIIGNQTVCAGSSLNLSGAGGVTYTWSVGSPFASIVVAPLANTCYSVIGTAPTTGCTNMAVACITVVSTSINIAASSPSVCLGTSATFTASGSTTYSWTGGSNTNTYNILPTASAVYTVSGIGTNGCAGSSTVALTVNNNCVDVWPGDANSDGIVNSSDVLELGLAFNSTGAPRIPGGNVYSSQFASNWTGTISTGKNLAHADCNGDGTINNADTIAIFNNLSMTHAFRPSGPSASADINIVIPQNILYEGQWNKAEIVLGTTSANINQLYGITFDVNFDNSLIEPNTAYIVYQPSFFDNGNQNINFRKTNFAMGKVYAASVRTDGNNVNGSGKIAELHFKLKSNIPSNSTMNLSITNSNKINADGITATVTSGSADAVTITNNLVGINRAKLLENSLVIYPNPASTYLNISSGSNIMLTYFISDITGRKIIEGSFVSNENLDISKLESGTYILTASDGNAITNQKIIISR